MLLFPALMGSAIPYAAAGAFTAPRTPRSGAQAPSPSASRFGSARPPDRLGHVAERVAPGVPVSVGVRRGADAQAVEHQDGGAPAHGREAVCTKRKRSEVTV